MSKGNGRLMFGVMILITCLVGVSIIDFGLPSAQRIAVVNGNQMPNETFFSAMQKQRVQHFSEGGDQAETVDGYPVKSLIAYRAYLWGSAQHDERHVYSTLAAMKPSKFDFHPRSFLYGGGYTYSVGALLFAMKKAGLITVTSQLSVYAENPSSISNMYIAGRGLNMAALVGVLALLFVLATRYMSQPAAFLALTFFLTSPVVITLAVSSKPHLFAAFFVILGVFLFLKYLNSSRRGWLVASGMSMGFAVGSAIVVAPVFLVYPMVLLQEKRREVVVGTLVAGLVGVLVFFVTNPYVLLDLQGFLDQVLASSSRIGLPESQDVAGGKGVAFINSLLKCYSWPFLILALGGIATSIVDKHRFMPFAVMIVVICVLFSVTVNRGRMLIFLVPFMCIASGLAIDALVERLRFKRLTAAIVAVAILPWCAGLGLAVYERVNDVSWYEPMLEWAIKAGPTSDSVVAVTWPVGPELLTPVPIKGKLVDAESDEGFEADYAFIPARETELRKKYQRSGLFEKQLDVREIGLRIPWLRNYYYTLRHSDAIVFARR